MSALKALRGEMLDVPARVAPEAWNDASLRHVADGIVVIDEGRIVDQGEAGDVLSRHSGLDLEDCKDCIIVPGFVDAHLHFPQIDMIGAGGEQLLGWLQRYTYPEEIRFNEPTVAKAAAARFVTELLANGTTTAAIYASSSLLATEALLEEAERRGIRAIVGKVSMDRGAPEALLSPALQDRLDNERLISNWHGRDDRLFIALTPRFALSCSEPLLNSLGELKRKHPSVYVQTHHAETMAEIAAVRAAFPQDADYLAVYERFGLIGDRSILGHGIYATESELDRIVGAGAAIAHCPTSNLFLGSGLFRLQEIMRLGANVALGSDIGGGTSLSTLRTMSVAQGLQQLRGTAISPALLLYLATLGGAEALRMDTHIGNFDLGKRADLVVLDWRRSRLLRERLQRTWAPMERLSALMTLGDDRLTERVLIGGKEVYRADA